MEYSAEHIETLSPGKAFRTRIGMFLSADLQEAMDLGLRELVYNAQDEYAATKQPDAFLKITIETKNNVITVEDNLRGIPCAVRKDGINSLTAALTIPHSGAKYDDKTAYSSSVGCNGEGLKIVCHTAKWLKATVHRDGKEYFQSFHETDEGAVADCDIIEKDYTGHTGTIIQYVPSPKVYGKNTRINISTLSKVLKELSYFSKGLTINLVVDGKEEIFKSDHGLVDGLDISKGLSAPFQWSYSDADCEVELALQWVSKKAEIKGYANGLYMPDGGAFISGFRSTLTRVFNSEACTKIDGDLIRSALDGFVSVKVRVGQFSNQAKTALANIEAKTATIAALTECLKDFVTTRTKDFNDVVEYLKRLSAAESAALEARNAVLAREKEFTEYSRCKISESNKLREAKIKGEDSMLIINEGLSAGGSISTGRQKAPNGNKIGILMLRGKAINPMTNSIEDVLDNEEIKLLQKAIGIPYGYPYDSKKLKYGKIAICADADFDGSHIGLLIMTIMQVLYPEMIKEKRLFWLKAPITKLETGKNTYYYYTEEEFEKRKETGNITFFKGLGQLSEQDLINTMFNPAEQRLEQIEPSRVGIKNLQDLMGAEVLFRKDYISKMDFGDFRL